MKTRNNITRIRIIKTLLLLFICGQAYLAQAQSTCVSTDQNTAGSISNAIGQSFTVTNCVGGFFHSLEIEKASEVAYTGTLAIYNGESVDAASIMYTQNNVTLSGSGFQTILLDVVDGSLFFDENITYTFVFSGFSGDFDFYYAGTDSYKDGKALLNGFNSSMDISFRVNAIGSEVLPVSLSSFEVQKNDGAAELIWTTASELNNAGFEVQHSSDAKNFESIGWVDGNGTSTNTNTYSFNARPEPGKNYYRLKQIDHDGQFTYSKPVMTVLATDYKVFPNPTSGIVKLHFNSSTDKSVKVYNATGDLVSIRNLAEDNQIDLSAQPAGIYLVQITAGQEKFEQRIIKI